MEEDAFAQLKASMREDSGSTIKYQQGCQKSRQTTWRDKRKQMDLRKAATGTALITQHFKDPSETIDNATSSAPGQPVLVEAVPTAAETKEAALVAGIKELKKLLRSIGQNLMRHTAVLYFMELQLQRPWETREALSLVVSECFGRATDTAKRLRGWESFSL